MRNRRSAARWIVCIAAVLMVSQLAHASGEPRWIPGVPAASPWTGTPSIVDMAIFNDGTSEALYVGGAHQTPAGPPSKGLLRWNGRTWSTVGEGFDGFVHSMQVFNDGSGPALFVAGASLHLNEVPWDVVKWNGSAWTGVSNRSTSFLYTSISAMEVFDDGQGAALYATGFFQDLDSGEIDGIVKWTGNGWQRLGLGLQSADGQPFGLGLTAVDDAHGNGSSLVVVGRFDLAGGVPAKNIAAWNGRAWSALGDGLALDAVYDVEPFEIEQQGPDERVLIAVGASFDGTSAIVMFWNGRTWSPFGPPISGWARDAAVLNVDGQTSLYLAGGMTLDAGQQGASARGVVRWTGEEWAALGSGLAFASGSPGSSQALIAWNDGSADGDALFVGGGFHSAGGYFAAGLARWGTPVALHCAADTSPGGGNAMIDIDDLLHVIEGWGGCDHPCGADCLADIDGNCEVDIDDLLAVINHCGPCPGSVWE